MRLYCMTLGRAVSIDCQVVVLNEQLCSQMFALHCVGSGSSAATILSFHNYGPSFVPLGSVPSLLSRGIRSRHAGASLRRRRKKSFRHWSLNFHRP